MAYNLQPLITILEQILDPQRTCWNIHDDSKPQLQSLLEKAISLQEILEKSHPLPNIEISLEREIRDAAHKAEDIIESRMVCQIRSRNLIGGWLIKWCKCFTFSNASVTEESMVKLVETTSGGGMIISSRGSSSSGGGGASIQSQSLLEKAISLQQILEKHPLPNIEISLERQIRDAALIAEDVIESRMVPQIRSRNLFESWLITWCKCFTFSSPGLQQVMQQLDSAMEQVLKLVESEDLQQVMLELDSAMEQVVKLVEVEAGNKMMISSRGPSSSGVGGGASLNPKSASGSIHVVGFDADLMELKDRLTGMQTKLEIIPIVGMGGAGKTTLARNLYEDPTIVSRFVARAWTTVSQDYDTKTILLSLVSCITGKQVNDGEVSVLKDRLYQSLYSRRYVIVLDDIWSTQVWDEMRMFFPDNNNGSRIMITTRESNVAKYANSQSRQHEVKLLSESASWDLLRQIVFGEDNDDCPFELESIGREMASDCGGLPLAITVIGGLLSKVERSEQVWENIGENVRAAIAKSEEGEQYSNIMSLSYNHLPNYLKPCFLYMAAFPEDDEIKGWRLIRLWIAEGFIKSNRDKSLEEVAEDYLKGLVERNLVMVRRNKSNKKAKRYIIHDVLRDLCIRKADEDKFLHVMNNDRGRATISKLRRVSCHKSYSHGILEEMYVSPELMSLARSFLCTDNWFDELVYGISSVSKLLRVLDIMEMRLGELPEEILQLVNLRYLGVFCNRIPVGISRLLNLQTLIADLSEYALPSEIWTMSELRHLNLGKYIWSKDDEIMEVVQLNKLQTISGYLHLTESLLERGFLQTIPNIKKLGLFLRGDSEIDLRHLHKLETLRYKSSFKEIGVPFPPSLRKLTLSYCDMNWRTVSTVCGLPNLEVLKIKDCHFELDGTGAEEWKAREGEEFRSLQFLQLDDLKLVRWSADETNFPKLRHLLVEDCLRLEEIPSGIGEIPTLELIEMKKCSASVVESAKQIVEVQQSDYGNYALQLRIDEYW